MEEIPFSKYPEERNVVIVMDNASSHKSKSLRIPANTDTAFKLYLIKINGVYHLKTYKDNA